MSQEPIKAWVVKTVNRYRGVLAAIIALQIASALLVSLQPRYFQKLVTLAVSDASPALLEKGFPVLAILLGLYLASSILQAVGGYIGCTFSSDLLKQLQIDFFNQLGKLPIQFFEWQPSGEFFTKFNHDIGNTQRFLSDFIPTAVREAITALAVTGILFYFCPTSLTLVALGTVVVTAALVVWLNRILARYAAKQRTGWSDINKTFDETVQGIDTLKIFGGEKRRAAMFMRRSSDLRDLSVRAGIVVAIFSPTIDLLSKVGGLLLVFLAYLLIAKGELEIEPFLLFFFYVALLQVSVSKLVSALANLQTELIGIRNIGSFFAETPEVETLDRPSERIQKSVTIRIDNLTFAYPGKRKLYKGANLRFSANGVTLIQGPSGSGKSTLINLLLKFYVPQQGSISYDGMDISRFERAELRNRIGVVTQTHTIFNESLRENMLIAKPGAGDAEIKEALLKAQLGSFMSRMPEDLDEILDPQGKRMSAGEKQRISIARLLLKESPILILDEPLSNLDMDARKKIAQVINNLRNETTIIILTHEWFPALAVNEAYRLDPQTGKFVQISRIYGTTHF